jgi:hypothetical protein
MLRLSACLVLTGAAVGLFISAPVLGQQEPADVGCRSQLNLQLRPVHVRSCRWLARLIATGSMDSGYLPRHSQKLLKTWTA